jgi:iron complex outermembrane recepter protein
VGSGNPYEIRYNRTGKLSNETGTQALKILHKTPSFDIVSITTHRASKQDGNRFEADYTEFDLFTGDYRFKFDNWTQEVRLQSGATNDRVKWLLGGYFESNRSIVDGEAFEIVGSGKDVIFSDANTRTFALFSQVDVQIAKPLTLSAGLRYETNRNKLENRERLFIPAGSPVGAPSGLAIGDQVSTDTAVLPKFSLLYQVNPNLSAYATIGRGYKPGGFNYRADNLESLVFRPEKSWNYEIGLKSSFLDNKLAANLALFTTTLNDYQVILPGPDGFFRNITNAEVGIKGLELELLAKPTAGWQLNASLGLLDGDFKQYRNPFTGQDFSGNRLVYAPNLTYNVGVQYRNPTGWFGRMEVQGFGTTFFDDANQLKQKPYALLNGRVGYEKDRYGIYVFANNILGTEYLTSSFVFPPPNIIGSYGERRTFGIQVKASF